MLKKRPKLEIRKYMKEKNLTSKSKYSKGCKPTTYKFSMKTMKIAVSTYSSIITLNVNELSIPFKRHRMTEWI